MPRVGDIVIISGLVNSAQYNGGRGIVLADAEPDDDGDVRHLVRLFDRGGNGAKIHVRQANIELSRDVPGWVVPAIRQTVLEMIKANGQLGNEDVCDEFASALWGEFAELTPAWPLTVDHGMKFRSVLMEADGHKIFWLAMDAISHHLIIEKCNGSWRVFQSHIKDSRDRGYAAADWCFGDLRNNGAWSKYGGGRILNDKDINDLLDLVVHWQKLIKVMLKRVLLKSVPDSVLDLDRSDISLLSGTPHDGHMEEIQKKIQKITSWSLGMKNRYVSEGCTTLGLNPSDLRVEEGREQVEIVMGRDLIFSISSSLYERCDTLSRKMTGQPVSNVVFFSMLNGGIWWESLRDPDTGSAFGFSFRALDLDMQLSEAEGIHRAEQMRKDMKEDILASSKK